MYISVYTRVICLYFSDDNSSAADMLWHQTSSEHHHSDPYREKLREVPSHIAQNQKLLKTSIFQTPQPQFPTKCLILNIYKIKHQQYEVWIIPKLHLKNCRCLMLVTINSLKIKTLPIYYSTKEVM